MSQQQWSWGMNRIDMCGDSKTLRALKLDLELTGVGDIVDQSLMIALLCSLRTTH